MSYEHLRIEVLPTATFTIQQSHSLLQKYYFGSFFKNDILM